MWRLVFPNNQEQQVEYVPNETYFRAAGTTETGPTRYDHIYG